MTPSGAVAVTFTLLGEGPFALIDDPRLASRLALWGRRLVGEALTQAQRVGIEREYLAGLLFADEAEEDELQERLSPELEDCIRVAKRLEQDAEAIALRELPWIPLMHYRSKALIAPRLHGYTLNVRNAAPTRFLRLDA